MNNEKIIIDIKNLKTHFSTERGQVTAVKGVTLHVEEGEILGIVGESGCGKSVTSQSVLRLFDEKNTQYEGEVIFEGTNLLNLSSKKMQDIRGNDISMIFQDPLSSLNPVYTVGYQVTESILLHQNISKKEAQKKAVDILKKVGIPSPEIRVNQYPHQLSGGMQQRVMIAMALACRPKLLIADEPTTALDVTIQAQILDLIKDLSGTLGMGVIFITHDLGVVAELCDRVAVMYLGQIVEEGNIDSVFEDPLHPYTKGLMQSIPQLDSDRSKKLHVIEGSVPTLDKTPVGCYFSTRCKYADELCRQQVPELKIFPRQKVRCWHAEKINQERKGNYVHQ